jgi:PKD repeat protein
MYNTPGKYAVKLTNTFGTCKEVVTKEVTVHDLPDPKGFIADMGGICGAPVTVQFNDTTPGAVRWEWRLEHYYNGNTSPLKNPTFRIHN